MVSWDEVESTQKEVRVHHLMDEWRDYIIPEPPRLGPSNARDLYMVWVLYHMAHRTTTRMLHWVPDTFVVVGGLLVWGLNFGLSPSWNLGVTVVVLVVVVGVLVYRFMQAPVARALRAKNEKMLTVAQSYYHNYPNCELLSEHMHQYVFYEKWKGGPITPPREWWYQFWYYAYVNPVPEANVVEEDEKLLTP